ncbi:PREDICTED: uncharacterized protein LOC108358177 [Rhagoletis zephyria]|uniref:uncharacterized protein LOC108358177 n=1 Tax=Rhagoletis zephyria TaxID=28612 RepID=UPI000811A59A|nr:PREDICTED: uncharacterized protein LOC108358177 [Rhagoletis zephyria]
MDRFLIRTDGNNHACEEESVMLNENEDVPKTNRRKICSSWIADFSDWLIKKETAAGDEELFCKVCNAFLKVSSGKSDLISHKNTQTHKTRSICITNSQTTIAEQFRNNTRETRLVQTL